MKTFIASLDKLHEMLQWIQDCAKQAGFSEQANSQIVLAAEEAIVNIIYYAYPHRQGSVDLWCEGVEGKELKLTIKDYGIPYDPLSHHSQDKQIIRDELKVGGYGIYFIRNVMDQVNYKRENNANVLTLVKYQ